MSVHRFATKDPTCCAVCRRMAHHIGHMPRYGKRVLWCCSNETCMKLIGKVYEMAPSKLSLAESLSLYQAGNASGQYLDEIGQTDVAKLTPEQWAEFWRRGLFAYEESMRKNLLASIG